MQVWEGLAGSGRGVQGNAEAEVRDGVEALKEEAWSE